jgi:TRAP-type C4-dicarboxylate transport system permease small subunit
MPSGNKTQAHDKPPRLQRLLHYTLAFEDGLLVVMLTAMILVAATQILLRNVFETGLAWGDPLLRMMVLWVGLLGAMVATRDRNHISIDILSRYLPGRARRISHLVTDCFTFVVCALLAFHGARFVWQDQAAGVRVFADLPAWLFELIIPIGFAVICVRYLLHFILTLRGGRP